MAQTIPVRFSYSNRRRRPKQNGRNVNNLISVRLNNSVETSGQFKCRTLPSFALINARSLLPKVDELAALVDSNGMDIVAITESWLHKDIDDNLLSISGYNIHRNDRTFSRVVVYVFIAHKIFLVSEDLISKIQILSVFGYGFVLHACQDPSRPLLFALCTTPLAEPLKNWLTLKNTWRIQ